MSGIEITSSNGKSDGSPSGGGGGAGPPPNASQAAQVLCRNILIHGYCKFADKGCVFRHDTQTQTQSQNNTPTESPAKLAAKKKLNADSPAFTPSFKPPGAKSPRTDVAPFVPKTFQPETSAATFNSENMFDPTQSSHFVPMNSQMHDSIGQGSMVHDFNSMSMDSTMHGQPPPPPPPQPPLDHMHGAGHDMMFNHHTAYPLQYHLYAPPPDRPRAYLAPNQRTPADFFISNNLREELQRKSEARLQQFHAPGLPEVVHVYHSLVPLDMNPEPTRRVFGYPTRVYKAISNTDGKHYCLRRVEGFKLTNERAMSVVNKWNRLDHCGVVRLHSAFTTRAFGDNSLVFVYDFHALATTIYDAQFSQTSFLGYYNDRGPYSEPLLWSYTGQILSALKAMHSKKLAARVIDPTKIIKTGQGRIRINGVGMHDFVNFEEMTPEERLKDLEQAQRNDIYSLGLLMLCLACNSAKAHEDIAKSMDFVAISFSEELVQFLKSVLSAESQPTVEHLMTQHASKMLDCMNGALNNADRMEYELTRELENGRLVRLMAKLSFITDRPEQEDDSAWSESGERYIIKLFHDHVYHQTDEYGTPVVDLGHVLTSLNKLDAGVDELVMLVSRDEQNCLLVTYKELKACVESAFRKLTRK